MKKNSSDLKRSLLSTRDVAWLLGVDESWVCRAVRLGQLPFVRRRGRVMVPTSAVTRLLVVRSSGAAGQGGAG